MQCIVNASTQCEGESMHVLDHLDLCKVGISHQTRMGTSPPSETQRA